MRRSWPAARAAAIVLLLAAGPGAHAQWWNPNDRTAPGKRAFAPPVVYSKQTQEAALQAILAALSAGDFAKLDRMHDEFLALMQAGGEGRNMYQAFNDAFDRAFHSPDIDHLGALFVQWAEKAPESRLRRAAEAGMWLGAAWSARGYSFADKVSPDAFRIFHERLEHAARVLAQARERDALSPLWYVTALNVAGSQGARADRIDRIFEEGIDRYPGFLFLYRARLNYLLPQWGGSFDQVDAFIRKAVLRTQATEGTRLYAELYRDVRERSSQIDLFHDTKASWRLMRHAYEDALALGQGDLDRYAAFACMARDRETTARLLRELGEAADLGTHAGFTTEACQEWVREAR